MPVETHHVKAGAICAYAPEEWLHGVMQVLAH